jgi:hypothetical protein
VDYERRSSAHLTVEHMTRRLAPPANPQLQSPQWRVAPAPLNSTRWGNQSPLHTRRAAGRQGPATRARLQGLGAVEAGRREAAG